MFIIPDVYLGPYQRSMMALFMENSERLNAELLHHLKNIASFVHKKIQS